MASEFLESDFQDEKNIQKTYYVQPSDYDDFFKICYRMRSSCNHEINTFIKEFNKKHKRKYLPEKKKAK